MSTETTSQDKKVTVYWQTKTGQALVDAISNFPASTMPIYALLYTPRKCLLGTVIDKKVVLPGDDKPVDLNQVFEARLFNADYELRWLNDPTGAGNHQTVTISQIKNTGQKKIECYQHKNRYLLWGEGTGNCDTDSSELATRRLGSWSVPISNVEKNQRVQLETVEYIQVCQDGNCAVWDERLMGLTLVAIEKNEGGHHG